MIRTKHEIDTYLVNFFLSEKNDKEINEALLIWYSSLGNKDHQNTRDNAIGFLKKMAFDVLSEINYPTKERHELIETFEPLELLLRTALSLKTPSGKHNVRDHLSHTVRNVLFTTYVLKKYDLENNSSSKRQLLIAAIFHDIAYPLEKLKQVGHSLGDATFKKLLNSKGNVEIELNNPDDLLEMLDFMGNTKDKLAKEISELEILLDTDPDNTKLLDLYNSTQDTHNKVEHIYCEIVSKAIAGKGLFDASHSISSVVLFLMPIVKYWRDSKPYNKINLSKICDICLTMTYHDRENPIFWNDANFITPQILRIMRISDELQEWDREQNSFIKDVKILNDPSTIISLNIELKDKSEKALCKSHYFIADKIKGLLPVINTEIIKINFKLPHKLAFKDLEKQLEKIEVKTNYICSTPEKISDKMELIFHNKEVEIKMVSDEKKY